MTLIGVISISSGGKFVLSKKMIEKLNIQKGEKFAVIGEKDTIVFKKLGFPSFKGFDKLLERTREHARKNNLTEKDMFDAIEKTRKKKLG